MYPYEHMIAMECKEVCILGGVKIFTVEKKYMMLSLGMIVLVKYVCDGVKKKGKTESVSGKAHTLAILSLGSLTAAIIAVGNLLLSQTS